MFSSTRGSAGTRVRNGSLSPGYTPLIRDVLCFPHGEVRSIIIKVHHNCTGDRRSYGKLEDPPIKHEYCVVFRKPKGESCVEQTADLGLGERVAAA